MRHDDRDELGITIGNIKLLYVVKAMRAWGNGRRLISCYELDGKPERYLMWVSEPELLSFQQTANGSGADIERDHCSPCRQFVSDAPRA